MGENQSAPRKKKRGVWTFVFIAAIVVFIGSILALGVIGYSYWQGQQKYSDIAEKAGFDADALGGAEQEIEALSVDWDALREVNSDVVAWVYIPNTPISYPVVQGRDNDEYLTVDFDRQAGWLANYGAIFLDYRNNPDFNDRTSFIYGHHMNDGTMFAELAALTHQDRFDECRTVYLLTPDGNRKLRSFALLHVADDDPLVQFEFADEEEFAAYVQDKIDRSVVEPGPMIPVEDMEQVFVFATCDEYGAGRYVLYAYEEDKNTTDLTGNLGLAEEDGQVVGFEEGFSEGAAAEDGQQSEDEGNGEGEEA